ncbi:MAG: glutamate racemase [Brevinemataceae bacterium]
MAGIGIIDSGVGGLSILKCLTDHFPNESFQYIADTKNMPYGNKTQKELLDILYHNISVLNKSKLIITACNTLSCLLGCINFPAPPVMGIIDSLVETTVQNPQLKKIGILATEFTINSNLYQKLLINKRPDIEIFQQKAPLLASAIEKENLAEIKILLLTYLEYFSVQQIDGLILGCTHYNLVIDVIKEQYPNWKIIDPYIGIINKTAAFLADKPEQTNKSKNIYLTSSYSEKLQYISETIMKQKLVWELL